MTRPQALLVMNPDTYRLQFGQRQMSRLRDMADTVGRPAPARQRQAGPQHAAKRVHRVDFIWI